MRAANVTKGSGDQAGSDPGAPLPLPKHFGELRRRFLLSLAAFVVAFAVAYFLYDFLVRMMTAPFEPLRATVSGSDLFYVNGIAEGFLVRLRIALYGGVVLSSPAHLYNLVRFVFPALSRNERLVMGAGLASSFSLACLSAWYGFTVLIPISVRFLSASGFIPEGVGVLLSFSQNLAFLFWVVAAGMLLFQGPVILMILLALGLVRRRVLLRESRYVIVGIFVAAAVLTPPDFVSQLALAFPLVGLYFCTLLVARVFRLGEG
jgi:sec-independent protein translocase protein TatC